MNNAIKPEILIMIETEYNIDSGNTNEYHPKNSPNAKRDNPIATEIAPLFRFSKYDKIVSIAPYASKIKEIDLKMCSICTDDTKNKGKIPTDLKYLDFGNSDLILCEKAMKKYPMVWMAIPRVWIHLSMFPDCIMKSSIM